MLRPFSQIRISAICMAALLSLLLLQPAISRGDDAPPAAQKDGYGNELKDKSRYRFTDGVKAYDKERRLFTDVEDDGKDDVKDWKPGTEPIQNETRLKDGVVERYQESTKSWEAAAKAR